MIAAARTRRGLAVALVALLALGCAPKRVKWDDPLLPEKAEEVVLKAPLGVLEDGAGNDDPSVRARALDLLIRAASAPGEGGWAQRALWDPDGWVQQVAVEALAERMDEPGAVALLEAFVVRTDGLADPYARGAAAVRLAKAGHTGTREAVSAAWHRERAAWRAAPLQLGALAMGDETAVAPLGKALAQANVALETGFLLDVGRSGRPELAESLVAGEEWVEEEMVLAYATARLLLGDDAAAKAIAQALDGSDDLVALEALDYLTAIDDERATALIRKARTGGTDLAKTYAALALIPRGEGSTSLLTEALVDEDPEVRALAVRFAVDAVIADPQPKKADRVARRVLAEALKDENLEVRVAALRGAARVGVLVPEPPVRALLLDELLAVRIEAAGALLARKG